MADKRFRLGYVCGDFGLIDNDKWIDLHSMSENSEKNVQICINKMNELADENEQLKQFKDTTFVLTNEMIETANLYRTPIKSLHYGDDLGYWNGVYQKLKELKEILFEKGDVE